MKLQAKEMWFKLYLTVTSRTLLDFVFERSAINFDLLSNSALYKEEHDVRFTLDFKNNLLL